MGSAAALVHLLGQQQRQNQQGQQQQQRQQLTQAMPGFLTALSSSSTCALLPQLAPAASQGAGVGGAAAAALLKQLLGAVGPAPSMGGTTSGSLPQPASVPAAAPLVVSATGITGGGHPPSAAGGGSLSLGQRKGVLDLSRDMGV